MPRLENRIDGLDGKPLHLTVWLPDDVPRAAVQLVHGFGEFAGRYDEWAGRFAARGYAVYLHDQRGHGKTPGKRGAIDDYALLLDDVQAVRNRIDADCPGLPAALYGHSMGGSVALNFLLGRQPERYRCAVISSPWLELRNAPPPAQVRLVTALSKLMPRFTIHSAVHWDILSHDKERVNASMSEGLYHNMLGAKILLQLLNAGPSAIARAGELTLPILLLQAGDDRLVSADATRRFAENAGENVTYVPYPNLYHELHNEFERGEIFEMVAEYLQKHL
jgi:alpha-beta hydrolase superfamily lysophospholipase